MLEKYIDELYEKNDLDDEKLFYILENIDDKSREYLVDKSHKTRMKTYGNKVFMRGLIEFTNYCKKKIVSIAEFKIKIEKLTDID